MTSIVQCRTLWYFSFLKSYLSYGPSKLRYQLPVLDGTGTVPSLSNLTINYLLSCCSVLWFVSNTTVLLYLYETHTSVWIFIFQRILILIWKHTKQDRFKKRIKQTYLHKWMILRVPVHTKSQTLKYSRKQF